jgi:peptide/nickel transport system permease protein
VIRYLVQRLLWMLVELLGISLVTFVLAYLVPADPARLYAGPHAPLSVIVNVRHQLGLDRPLWVQYVTYLWRLLHLDLGTSYELHIPVLQAILQRVPATAELALGGVIFEVLLGIPIGLLAAIRPRGLVDRVGTIATLLGISTPPFVLSYALIYVVWFRLNLFESGGYGDPLPLYLFLPALALGLSGAAFYARLLRSNMQDILRAEYVRVARAKGVPGYKVLLRHAFPNAFNVLLTQLGLDIGFFLSGVLVIEVPFSWPGIGRQAWEAITNLDVPLVLGTVLFGTACILLANIVVDIAYAFLDPRVRYE